MVGSNVSQEMVARFTPLYVSVNKLLTSPLVSGVGMTPYQLIREIMGNKSALISRLIERDTDESLELAELLMDSF